MGRAVLVAAALAAVAIAGAGGCLRSTSYACDSDGECVSGGQGTCEAVGYCSFDDGSCPSGRRFADGAGPYAGTCVDDDPDAGVIDARVDARTDAAIDAAIDAAVDAPVVVGCTSPGNATTFPNGPPCTGWGVVFADSASVQNTGGRLTVTPSTTGVSSGGCVRADVPFAAAGALVEIERALTGANARTRLDLPGSGLSIGVEGDAMVARAADAIVATVPYNEVAMRWWRLRPANGGVLFETAPDGLTWSPLAQSPVAPPAMASLRVIGETIGVTPMAGAARIQRVNECP